MRCALIVLALLGSAVLGAIGDRALARKQQKFGLSFRPNDDGGTEVQAIYQGAGGSVLFPLYTLPDGKAVATVDIYSDGKGHAAVELNGVREEK